MCVMCGVCVSGVSGDMYVCMLCVHACRPGLPRNVNKKTWNVMYNNYIHQLWIYNCILWYIIL